jgi:hypothetical protein
MNFILSRVDPLMVDLLNLPVFPTAEHKFGADTFDFALLFWTSDFSNDPESLQSDLNFRICRVLKAAKQKMPMHEGAMTDVVDCLVKV